MNDTRLWHGGVPGLRVGDLLLPSTETDTADPLTRRGARLVVDRDHVRQDRVHLTNDRAAARAFAAAFPDGALYVAEPIGETEPDPDAPDGAIRCPQARITAVYDPCVRWSERGVRWLRPLLRPAP